MVCESCAVPTPFPNLLCAQSAVVKDAGCPCDCSLSLPPWPPPPPPRVPRRLLRKPCFCSAAAAIVAVVMAAVATTGWLQRLPACFGSSTVSFAASQVPVKRREPQFEFCMAALQYLMLPQAFSFRQC